MYSFNIKKMLKTHLDFQNIPYSYKVKNLNLFYSEHILGNFNKLTYAQLPNCQLEIPHKTNYDPKRHTFDKESLFILQLQRFT